MVRAIWPCSGSVNVWWVARQRAVAGDLDAGAGGDHLVEGDTHVDAAADEARVDRVVVGVDPHVVIPGQAHD